MSSLLAQPIKTTPWQKSAPSCPVCCSLVFEYDTTIRGLTIPISDLKKSAKGASECRSCTLLWKAISRALKDQTTMPDALYESILVESKPPKHPGPMVVYLYPDPVAYGIREKTFQLYTTDDDSPSPWDLIGHGFHIPEYGLSPSCVALAREWLNACSLAEGKHANCTKTTISKLPTRVISVGSNTESPRLVVTEPNQQAHYAALSHCWGGSTPAMTTLSNLDTYTISLPDDLPQTFADALQVARALDIPYLWIDSLCIVQDSPEDWKHEACRMAQVYANAYVTIFADAAQDSTAGFLAPPSRKAPDRFVVPYENDPSGSGTIHIRRRGFLARELPYHTWSNSGHGSGQSKLSTRGWVFQERLLSPRTLHFSENEMAWECRSVCECECSATSLRTLRTTSVMKHFLHPQDPDVSLAEANWRSEIVPAYTQLDLTFPTDRLPAIQGLANAAHKLRSDDEYISGLWRKTMKADLLWHRNAGDLVNRRIKKGGAPTWSWASITGPVEYRDRITPSDSELEILDIITSEDRAPVLVIRGHLVKVKLEYPDTSTVSLGPDDELTMVWDCERDIPTFKKIFRYFLVFGADDGGPFGLLLSVDPTNQPGKQFRRIGYIPGDSISKWRRSWGSGGWVSSVANSVSESSDDIWEDSKGDGAREWVKEIFQGEPTTFRLV
ncbi:het domain protein [Fusarium beomiforme]|uniref:Het domain protein n=1 Tax=Fusarium beomiforme TaxID=44412 RepID=A0A9P5DSS4_9HYPO|nr:het domain protein [Fusarium beomiforme]